jgi:hypothetical protein
MTKAENRAAAKAFHEERERLRREEWRAQAFAADLEQLDKLRRYLIFRHQGPRTGARVARCHRRLCGEADGRSADFARSEPRLG